MIKIAFAGGEIRGAVSESWCPRVNCKVDSGQSRQGEAAYIQNEWNDRAQSTKDAEPGL